MQFEFKSQKWHHHLWEREHLLSLGREYKSGVSCSHYPRGPNGGHLQGTCSTRALSRALSMEAALKVRVGTTEMASLHPLGRSTYQMTDNLAQYSTTGNDSDHHRPTTRLLLTPGTRFTKDPVLTQGLEATALIMT